MSPQAMPSERPIGIGHNGGPPLNHVPEWGRGGVGNYFEWRAAREAVFKAISPEMRLRHQAKAAALGLTYDEYVIEYLERGRFLQVSDGERIAAIKAARKRRR